MPYYISPPPPNLLTRILATVVAVVSIVAFVMVGMVALVVVVGVGLIAAVAIWLRVAWIKRRMQKSGIDLGVKVETPRESGQVIDAEYTVISEQPDPRDQ